MSYWSLLSQAYASWPLQDDSATTAVVAESGPSATVAGGKDASTMTAPGPNGWLPKAFDFDGANDYLSLASDLPNYPGWSLEAWLRYEDASFGTIIELRGNNSARLGTRTDGTMVGAFFDGTDWYTVANPIAPDAWHHAAVVWDGIVLRNYLNGVEVGSTPAETSQHLGFPDPDEIGRAGWGSLVFDGRLAGLRVHPVLAAADVAELYSGPEPTVLTPPILSNQVVAGAVLAVPAGDWASHGNGPLSISTALQLSPNGVNNWQSIEASRDASSFVVPASYEGAYIRVLTTAANDGGESEPALSESRQVLPTSHPFSAVAAAVARSGASAATAVPSSGVVAGMIFHG